MKNTLVFALLISTSLFLFSEDHSTPDSGNLYLPQVKDFTPTNIVFYESPEELEKWNLTLYGQRIISSLPKAGKRTYEEKTIGSDPVTENEISVVLTGETTRYAHGILGDSIESTGFKVYKNDDLVGAYELPESRVFETLRPTMAEIIPENEGLEILLTSSNKREGARVDIFSIRGELLGSSPSIGRGFRWLHLLGVAPMGEDFEPTVALVRTPHINGILELYRWNGSSMVKKASLGNVSTHQIGSDNLNMAVLLDSMIILPTFDYRKLLIVQMREDYLVVTETFSLPARIASNLHFDDKSQSLWFALSNGSFVRIF